MSAIATRSADDERGEKIVAMLLRALLSSKWVMPRTWRQCVVTIEPGHPPRAVARAELAERFRSAGDDRSAHDVLARRVPYGSCLAWVVRDDDEGAFAGLVVVNMRGSR